MTLAGTASDSDGIKTVQWTAISCPSATCSFSPVGSLNTTAAGLTAVGVYTFRLTATDNLGVSNSDDVVVTVNSSSKPNPLPTVDAGSNQTITLPTTSTTLVGTMSDDGAIKSRFWTVVSKPAGSNPIIGSPVSSSTVVLNMTVAGTYQFMLTVVDDLGASASDTVTVTVNSSSGSPDLNTIIATAKQWVSASPSQRSQYEAVLQSWTDVSTIDQIIEAVRPKGTETQVGEIFYQYFDDPLYNDQGYHLYVPTDYNPSVPRCVIIWQE